MTIKLLTFDLDNTLWDVEPIVLRAENVMQGWITERYPDFFTKVATRDFSRLRDAVLHERPEISHDLTQLRTEVLRRAFLQAGHVGREAEQAAAAAFACYFHERNKVDYFPGALQALADLRRDFPLYALSNGNADIQRIGLGHIFSKHFSAISVGAAKPDPRIYRAALEAAEIMPHEVIHVGDHPTQDVEAAQNVGMRTVWVNFTGQTWPDIKAADGEIHHFDELPALIRALASR